MTLDERKNTTRAPTQNTHAHTLNTNTTTQKTNGPNSTRTPTPNSTVSYLDVRGGAIAQVAQRRARVAQHLRVPRHQQPIDSGHHLSIKGTLNTKLIKNCYFVCLIRVLRFTGQITRYGHPLPPPPTTTTVTNYSFHPT